MKVAPAYLKPGDKIAIISPASVIDPAYIDGAVAALRRAGYVPVEGAYCRGSFGTYTGTVEERLSDLRGALECDFRAILCGRGGYGVAHLLEFIEPELVERDPKWLIGFSDISALHGLMQRSGICSIHSSMAKHLALYPLDDEVNSRLLSILTGGKPRYEVEPHPFNRIGTAQGIITGGNMAVLSGLIGTPFDILSRAEILFVEDIAEPVYKVERMLYNLRLSGALGRLKGLIVGQFTDYPNPDRNGDSMEDMIRRMVEPYGFPVAYNFPIGHFDGNLPLIEGAVATLSVTPSSATLKFD